MEEASGRELEQKIISPPLVSFLDMAEKQDKTRWINL